MQPKFETDEAMRGREGEGEDEFPRQNGVQKKVLLAIRMPTYKLAGREGKGRKEGRTDYLKEPKSHQTSNMTLPNYFGTVIL